MEFLERGAASCVIGIRVDTPTRRTSCTPRLWMQLSRRHFLFGTTGTPPPPPKPPLVDGGEERPTTANMTDALFFFFAKKKVLGFADVFGFGILI